MKTWQIYARESVSRANEAYLTNRYGVHGVSCLCQHKLPQDCGLRSCHSLYLASKASEAAVIEEEGDARRGIGIDNAFLPEAELLRRFQLKKPGRAVLR